MRNMENQNTERKSKAKWPTVILQTKEYLGICIFEQSWDLARE